MASDVEQIVDARTQMIRTTTPQATLEWIFEQVSDQAGRPLEGIAVASFGPLNLERGIISMHSPKLAWRGFNLRQAFTERFPRALFSLTTDTQASALGEAVHGIGHDQGVIAYVTVGTGVGLGLASSQTGILSTSGHPEFGHIRVSRRMGDLFQGVCSFHGDCLEGLVSGPALAVRAGVPDATELPDSDSIWSDVCNELGSALATLTLTVAPNRIILGGGIASRPFLHEHVRNSMDRQIGVYLDGAGHPTSDTRIARPSLGVNSALIGAFAHLDRKFQSKDRTES